ncbi:MAG TPA: hypothetical protein VMW93_07220 [bacterium]|nr:hypothetical protein [bacterium]
MNTIPLWIEFVTVGAEVKAALRVWSDRDSHEEAMVAVINKVNEEAENNG